MFAPVQVFVEGLHRFFGAEVAHHAVGLDGLAFAFGLAFDLDLDVVVLLRGAAFDWRECSGALAHFFESLRDIVVGDVHRRHFDVEIFVVAELKFGEHFEDGAEFQRLAFGEVELFDLRLRNRRQLLLDDGFLDGFGDERLKDFALDVFGEALADQRDRRFAGAEAGDARELREFFRDTLHFFGDDIGGDFEVEFATAGCGSGSGFFSHGRSFSVLNVGCYMQREACCDLFAFWPAGRATYI